MILYVYLYLYITFKILMTQYHVFIITFNDEVCILFPTSTIFKYCTVTNF